LALENLDYFSSLSPTPKDGGDYMKGLYFLSSQMNFLKKALKSRVITSPESFVVAVKLLLQDLEDARFSAVENLVLELSESFFKLHPTAKHIHDLCRLLENRNFKTPFKRLAVSHMKFSAASEFLDVFEFEQNPPSAEFRAQTYATISSNLEIFFALKPSHAETERLIHFLGGEENTEQLLKKYSSHIQNCSRVLKNFGKGA